MFVGNFISQIIREMWLCKLRLSLAIFCIAFGTFIMSMLLALSLGFYKTGMSNLKGIVDNTCIVWQGIGSKSYKGYPKGQANDITISDVIELPKIFPNIKATSTHLTAKASVGYAGKTYSKIVNGITLGYTRLNKYELTTGGRFFNKIDMENRARVTILSEKMAKDLFGNKKVLNEKILIDGVPFVVIGVLKKRTGGYVLEKDVLITHQSYVSLYGKQPIQFFQVLVKSGTKFIDFEQTLRNYFAQKKHFDKSDKRALGFWSSSEISDFVHWFMIGVHLFLTMCGLMVLGVGSIGVANIMFLIVEEKTYAIGMQKVLGATNQQIFMQLFFEAFTIVGIGGFLGTIVSFFTIIFLQHTTLLPSWLGIPVMSWPTIIFTVFILTLTTLVTGFFPARRAAKMDPIEALSS